MAEPDIDALVAAEFGSSPPPRGDDIDALVAAEFASPPKAPRRAGSTVGTAAEPAGESDATSSGFLDTAKKVGAAVVDVVTGESKRTAETEALTDFRLMPEMRQTTISNALPALGVPLGAAVAGAEGVLRNASTDPSEGFGLGKAFQNAKANALTQVGSSLASAAEQVKAIVANNPDVKVRQDEKGNTILTSAQDGKEYVVPPGVDVLDAPRAAQTVAAGIPAFTAGPATVFGRTLGNLGSKALAGATMGGIRETAQAAGGADFNPGDVVVDAIGNAVVPAAQAVKGAVRASSEAALKAAQEDAAKRAAAAAAKAPSSFADVVEPIQAIADRVGQLGPKQRWLLKQVPIVGKALDEIDQLAKILKDEAGEGAKKLPKEARELVDDILKGADETTEAVAKTEAPAVADDVAAAVDDSVSAIEPPTIDPTRTVGSPARARAAPQEVPTPPTPAPAPVPDEVTAAARARPVVQAVVEEPTVTAVVPRQPPPTEGLEPTEVLPREVVEAVGETVRKRRVSEDEAKALIRSTALELGTLDLATLASKARLSSSQAQRALEQLVRDFKFRSAVADKAAEIAPAVPASAPAPTLAAAREVPADVAGEAEGRLLRDAAAKAENMLAVEPEGRMANVAAATKEASKWKAQFEALPAERRAAFVRQLLDTLPKGGKRDVHGLTIAEERVRTRLGLTLAQWRRFSFDRGAR